MLVCGRTGGGMVEEVALVFFFFFRWSRFRHERSHTRVCWTAESRGRWSMLGSWLR